jgi:hypothetical protein
MRGKLVVLVIALSAATVGCRSDPQAKERAAKEREAATVKADEEGTRNADWGKINKDAARMEEKSRQRAERQRAQMLEKANKE